MVFCPNGSLLDRAAARLPGRETALSQSAEKPGNLSFCRSGMELCAGGSVVWLGIKGSFSFLYGVRLCGNQCRDADQVVGDEVQQESSVDTSNPAMLSLAHRAMLLAPAKDAFDHFAALLRHAIARVP